MLQQVSSGITRRHADLCIFVFFFNQRRTQIVHILDVVIAERRSPSTAWKLHAREPGDLGDTCSRPVAGRRAKAQATRPARTSARNHTAAWYR